MLCAASDYLTFVESLLTTNFRNFSKIKITRLMGWNEIINMNVLEIKLNKFRSSKTLLVHSYYVLKTKMATIIRTKGKRPNTTKNIK